MTFNSKIMFKRNKTAEVIQRHLYLDQKLTEKTKNPLQHCHLEAWAMHFVKRVKILSMMQPSDFPVDYGYSLGV